MKYLILLLFPFTFFAQSFTGAYDNFLGYPTVFLNPANIADGFYKQDFHIAGTSGLLGNDYVAVNRNKVLSDLKTFFLEDPNNAFTSDVDSYLSYNSSNTSSNLYANVNALGPGAVFTINRVHSFAITTRLRNHANIDGLNTSLYDTENNSINVNSEFASVNTNGTPTNFSDDRLTVHVPLDFSAEFYSWLELGFSYATVLYHRNRNFIKVGGSFKINKGITFTNFKSSNINADVNIENELGLNTNIVNADIDDAVESLIDSGKLNYEREVNKTSLIDDIGNPVRPVLSSILKKPFENIGIGIDLGIVYEYRARDRQILEQDKNRHVYTMKAPYKFRLAASIRDLGFIRFGTVDSFSSGMVDSDTQENQNQLDLNTIFSVSSQNFTESNSKTLSTPLVTNGNIDVRFYDHIYLNTDINLFILANDGLGNAKYISNFTITPRYERPLFSLSVPMNLNRYRTAKIGLNMRSSFFYAGSSSVLTNLLSSTSKEIDLYLGFKVPILNKKKIKEYKYARKEAKRFKDLY